MKIKTKPSENKTERGSWNRFDSLNLDCFIRIVPTEFVDVIDNPNWQNSEDTVVVVLPSKLAFHEIEALRCLDADEMDYKILDKGWVIVRLWWD